MPSVASHCWLDGKFKVMMGIYKALTCFISGNPLFIMFLTSWLLSVFWSSQSPSNFVGLVMHCHLHRKGPFSSSGCLAFSSISYHGLIDNSLKCSSCQPCSRKPFAVYPRFLSLGPSSSNPQCFPIIKVYLFSNQLYYSAFYKSRKAGALAVLMNTA